MKSHALGIPAVPQGGAIAPVITRYITMWLTFSNPKGFLVTHAGLDVMAANEFSGLEEFQKMYPPYLRGNSYTAQKARKLWCI